MRIAILAYHPELIGTLSQLRLKWEGVIEKAASQGAQLILFPEYAGLEMISAAGLSEFSLDQTIQYCVEFQEQYLRMLSQLAEKYQVVICGGSFPTLVESKVVNQVPVVSPGNRIEFQTKQIATQFERVEWGVSGDPGLNVFEWMGVRFGICICYDIEFPLIARSLCESGAELLLCPSCTDSMAGFFRVETGCKARALENQCYVVQAPLVGECDWSPAIDINVGAPGVFGPSDLGFPDAGVVAQGEFNTVQVLIHDFDLEKVRRVRQEGAVRNYQHWSEQAKSQSESVPVVSLDK